MFFPINTGWFTWYCSGYSAPYKMHRCCPLSKSFGHVPDFEFFKFFNNSNAYFSFKILSRSGISHWRSSIKKGALKYFPKFKGKHLCQSLFFNKLQTLTQVFSCEFCKNFRKTFLQNTSQRLFLNRFSISYISLLNGIFTLSYWSTGENLNYCHLLQSLLDSCKTIFGQVYLQIPRIHLCWIFGLDKLDMYCLRCS